LRRERDDIEADDELIVERCSLEEYQDADLRVIFFMGQRDICFGGTETGLGSLKIVEHFQVLP